MKLVVTSLLILDVIRLKLLHFLIYLTIKGNKVLQKVICKFLFFEKKALIKTNLVLVVMCILMFLVKKQVAI